MVRGVRPARLSTASHGARDDPPRARALGPPSESACRGETTRETPGVRRARVGSLSLAEVAVGPRPVAAARPTPLPENPGATRPFHQRSRVAARRPVLTDPTPGGSWRPRRAATPPRQPTGGRPRPGTGAPAGVSGVAPDRRRVRPAPGRLEDVQKVCTADAQSPREASRRGYPMDLSRFPASKPSQRL